MFNKPYHFPEDQKVLHELLEKYEKMQHENKSQYFEVDELIILASYLASSNRPLEAEAIIDYALRLHPGNSDIMIYQAQNLAANNDFEAALQILDKINEQYDREVIFTRASILLHQHHKEKVNEIFQNLAQEECYSAEVLLDIADVYMDEDMEPEAYTWLMKAIEKHPENKDVKEDLRDFYVKFDRHQDAISIMKELLNKDPYNIDEWNNLTGTYLKIDDIEQAFEAVDFALAIDKNNQRGRELKAATYISAGNIDQGIKILETLSEENNMGMEATSILLNCYTETRDTERGIAFCNKMLQQPDLFETEKAKYHCHRAIFHLMKKDIDACKKDISSAMTADSNYAESYEVLGEYFLANGDVQSAENEFKTAYQLATEKDEILEKEALAFFRSGYLIKAIEYFEQLEKEYHETMEANYHFLALAYFYTKKDPELTKHAIYQSMYYTPEMFETIEPMKDSENPAEVAYYELARYCKEWIDKTGRFELSDFD